MLTYQHLEAAFPEGFLPRRGVITLCHWQCVYAGATYTLPRAAEGDFSKGVPVPGATHSTWRYMTNWEISEGGEQPPVWTNRSGADMGTTPENIWKSGDLLPNLKDDLTWFILLSEVPRRVYRGNLLSLVRVLLFSLVDRILGLPFRY